MNKIILLAVIICFGYPSYLTYTVARDSVPIKEIQVTVQKRETMSLEAWICRKHFQDMHMDTFLKCHMNRTDI